MRPVSIESPGNQRIRRALAVHGPMDIETLAKAACLSRETLTSSYHYLPQLRALGIVRVSAWVRANDLDRSGPPKAIYALGSAPDAKRPMPLSDKERAAKYKRSAKGRLSAAKSKIRRRGFASAEPLLAALMMPLSTNAAGVAAEGNQP